MSRAALFPGTFNPFTLGHADIVDRALRLFDTVVVAVGCNIAKQGDPSPQQRVAALQQLYNDNPRVQVVSYTGLTANLARSMGIGTLVRGVRSAADYEYELNVADVNRRLAGLETVLLTARPELACVSSSVVRELAHHGHDITQWLPAGLKYPTP